MDWSDGAWKGVSASAILSENILAMTVWRKRGRGLWPRREGNSYSEGSNEVSEPDPVFLCSPALGTPLAFLLMRQSECREVASQIVGP